MEHGDLTTYFDRDVYSDVVASDEDADSLRLGAKHPNLRRVTSVLGSLIVQNVLSAPSRRALSLHIGEKAYSVDVQDIVRDRATRSCKAASSLPSRTRPIALTLLLPGDRPGPQRPPTRRTGSSVSTATSRSTLRRRLTITAGASFDSIEIGSAEEDAVNPKLGIVWRPTARTTVRAAAFETLYNDSDDVAAQPAAAARARASRRLHAVHLRRPRRRGDSARASPSSTSCRPRYSSAGRQTRGTRERTVSNHCGREGSTTHCPSSFASALSKRIFYWMPLERISFSARYEHGRYRQRARRAARLFANDDRDACRSRCATSRAAA